MYAVAYRKRGTHAFAFTETRYHRAEAEGLARRYRRTGWEAYYIALPS